MYYRLKFNRNEGVYFIISKDDSQKNWNINSGKEKHHIRNILEKYLKNMPTENMLNAQSCDDTLLVQLQPDSEQFRKQYDDLIIKEKKHEYLECGLLTMSVILWYCMVVGL